MKDLNEIMNEMDKITIEQVAVENDEKDLAGLLDAQEVVDPVLATNCCIVTPPEGFILPPTPSSDGIYPSTFTRLAINVGRLVCTVEPTTINVPSPCGGTITNVPVFALRISGCIPYLINFYPVLPNPLETICISRDAANLSLCCNDTVCVNRIVGYFTTEAAARAACTGFNCTSVTASLVARRITICDNSIPAVQLSIVLSTSIGNCP